MENALSYAIAIASGHARVAGAHYAHSTQEKEDLTV
jgi:hypothetical protein